MTPIMSQKKRFFLFCFFSSVVFLQGIFFIPALDRDESRFAAASKNMIQTKDYVDIRLEGEPRYKKPIGIYWAQSLSTTLLGESPYDEIWTYRIPSFLGIILSIILIYLRVKKIFGEEEALLSCFFLSTSLLLISEIHQAKSDGLLFLFITICNLILLSKINESHNLKKNNTKQIDFQSIIFWISLGLGVLIKGPIIIIFVFVPLILFSLIKKNIFFIKTIHSFLGYMIFFIIIVPWFVIISIKSGGIFWHESLINDLLRKVGSGQESHGFFPGYYSLFLFIFLWPASTFIINFFLNAFRNRKNFIKINEAILFLICWFLPCFLIYEMIPTKLPHYVLPSYPALIILLSIYITKNNKSKKQIFDKYSFLGFIPYPIIFISAMPVIINHYSNIDFFTVIFCILLISVFIFCLFQISRKNFKKFIAGSFFFQLSVYLSLVHHLNPKLEKFWIAERINKSIEISKNFTEEIFHYGFNEPSLVFKIEHKSQRLSPEDMYRNSKRIKALFILTEKEEKIFREFFEKDDKFKLIDNFVGFNYSQGRYIKFFIYRN